MIRTFGFISFLLLAKVCIAQKSDSIDVSYNRLNISNVLNDLSQQSGYNFSYPTAILDEVEPVSLQMQATTLVHILDVLFSGTDINYIISQDMVILKKRRIKPLKLHGIILDEDTGLPLPYSTLQVLGLENTGTVADYKGKFDLTIKRVLSVDSIQISSVGYEKKRIHVQSLDNTDLLEIKLKQDVVVLNALDVMGKPFREEQLGIEKRKPKGDLYMDTHGQQTALLFRNDRQLTGKIDKVNFFLSAHGNTHAPFRIRIYDADSTDTGPSKDLLTDIVVVKPETTGGWYSFDLLAYDLDIPEHGFFVAMEGVFPNDHDFYINQIQEKQDGDRIIKKKKNIYLKLLSYGQKLGFVKAKRNDTWHYSLSETWFQLEGQPFNVMITADILVEE